VSYEGQCFISYKSISNYYGEHAFLTANQATHTIRKVH